VAGRGRLRIAGLELNDAGVLQSADDIWSGAEVVYRETRPGRLWRNYEIGLATSTEWNFGGTRRGTTVQTEASTMWTNYLTTSLVTGLPPRPERRCHPGGPLMAVPLNGFLAMEAHSNFAATTSYGGGLQLGRSEAQGWECIVWGEWSTRAGDRWSLSVEPSFMRGETSRQYIDAFDGGPAATFGQRYVFSRIIQSELAASLRVNYYFTPDLSLEVYARPYAASGHYFGFGELLAARGRALRVYGTDGTTITETEDGVYEVTDATDTLVIDVPDFGERSFSSNVVLRWEFRPGSTLYLVWQQNRALDEDPGRTVGPRALWRSVRARSDNFFAIKIKLLDPGIVAAHRGWRPDGILVGAPPEAASVDGLRAYLDLTPLYVFDELIAEKEAEERRRRQRPAVEIGVSGEVDFPHPAFTSLAVIL